MLRNLAWLRLGSEKCAGFRAKSDPSEQHIIVPYQYFRLWLCRQSEANPSLPAIWGIAG